MKIRIKPAFFLIVICIIFHTCSTPPNEFTNSLGIKFIRIEAGSFSMGESAVIPDEMLHGLQYLKHGDWDEHPVHNVKISKPFYISETEVTIQQFREFRENYQGVKEFSPYASGISWNEAQQFCTWLSQKEGKTYRLPTEAEWEYVCRAGTSSLFSSGDTIPESGVPNAWGVKNMHTNVLEWCYDWHGPYQSEAVKDPVGPESGIAKVVRGGGLDRNEVFYARSANRGGVAPDFPPVPVEQMNEMVTDNIHSDKQTEKHKPNGFKERHAYANFVRDVLDNQGNHPIGIRLVQSPLPKSEFIDATKPFVEQCIKQSTDMATTGPEPDQPYFRKRYLLPTPPENTQMEKLKSHRIAGFHPGILGHHHSPALVACPNGDMLAVYYTSINETTPDVAMIAARLRFGSDQWDMPDFWLDFPDANDHAPLLWCDNDTIRFFWGNNKLDSGFPFQWITSTDNGCTWSPVHFPIFKTPVGGHSAQPINSAFRDDNGTMYVASDGVGPESILWVSHDNGETWLDTGGRSGGRHTTFVRLKDGRILGMGGKSSSIDGYMPKSISSDGGKTWTISKTPFCALGSNQRPTIIRLQSGGLFFAGDLQHRSGAQPTGFTQRGCYVALSQDDGQTWHIKKLPGAQEHEWPSRRKDLRGTTLGYSVASQAPNGVIHLITSMNQPCLHFEMNEAWILTESDSSIKSEKLMESTTDEVSHVKQYKEYGENKKVKAIWNAGIGDDGRYILHGAETWYYPNGRKQWETMYDKGKKTGEETYWDRNGKKLWSWKYENDGSAIWSHWYSDGHLKSQSIWRNKMCQGTATLYDQAGEIIEQINFVNGVATN